MDAVVFAALSAHFGQVDDQRVDRTKVRPLLSIIGIALSAVLGSASSWDDVALFGETHHA